jgi:hypothetical protein
MLRLANEHVYGKPKRNAYNKGSLPLASGVLKLLLIPSALISFLI